MKFLICIFNLIYLNFIIIIKKEISKKKVIIFYHPNVKLINIHARFIEGLLNNNEYFVLNLHQNYFLKKKKYFFLIDYFCNFILNSDFFISNNVCDFFTPNSKRIYIHHDIYDTPLIDKKKEKNLNFRLLKYDYILLASNITKQIFLKLFDKNSKKPLLKTIGYFKLDAMIKKFKDKKKIKNKIIIAPTNFLAFKKFTIYKNLDKILDFLLLSTKYKIIFRPHPSNLNSVKVNNILKKYSNFKNFYLDNSTDYSNIYLNSLSMITDISGTAYTYAFLTKNPVIFFRSYKKNIEQKFANLKYFQDRKKIGVIFDNIHDFKKLKKIIKNKQFYKKNISKILSENFDIGKTKINFFKFLKNVSN